ncbi:hypothetical protein BB560_002641 [Smittium megazygosporum]|uniref:Conserved oligomeric Golgi complex subunit 7 n=1 Tax=Smittium megazygosporum TaxID=133381 RepID=A0A2T9ZE64_9FUNG|nr:hypothetical protein BB560_002641 [Smittium megazygosporum]
MTVSSQDFRAEDFDCVAWINSFLNEITATKKPQAEIQYKVSVDDKEKIEQDKEHSQAEFEECDLEALEEKLSDLTKQLYLLSSEEQNNLDLTRIRLERIISYLPRELNSLKSAVSKAENDLNKIEPVLPEAHLNSSRILKELSKMQLTRHRLYETKSVAEDLEKLVFVPKEILELKSQGDLIRASDKLTEAIKIINHLESTNQVDKIVSDYSKQLFLDTSDEELSPPSSKKNKDLGTVDYSSKLSNLLVKYSEIQKGLLKEGMVKLGNSILEKNQQECRIWIKFFEHYQDFSIPSKSYLEVTGNASVELWKAKLNQALSIDTQKIDESVMLKYDPPALLRKVGIFLRDYFQMMVIFLREELEFCDDIEIRDSQLLVPELMTILFKHIGEDILLLLGTFERSRTSELDSALGQFISVFQLVLEFISTVLKLFDDLSVLHGVGETTELSKTSLIQRDSTLNTAFSYILEPFISKEKTFIEFEKTYLNSEISRIFSKYFQIDNLLDTSKQDQSFYTGSLEDTVLNNIKAIQKHNTNIKQNMAAEILLLLEKTRSRSVYFMNGLAAYEIIGIFDESFSKVFEKYADFTKKIFSNTFIPLPASLKSWVESEQSYSNDSENLILPETAIWWAQVELCLALITTLVTMMDQLSAFIFDFVGDLKRRIVKFYYFNKSSNRIEIRDSLHEPYLTMSSSLLNSMKLVQMLDKIESFLSSDSDSDSFMFSSVLQEPNVSKDEHVQPSFLICSDDSLFKVGDLYFSISQVCGLLSYLVPKSLNKFIYDCFSKFQLSLFCLIFNSQLNALKKIPALDVWSDGAKGSFNTSNGSEAKYSSGSTSSNNLNLDPAVLRSKIQLPKFSHSPSSTIRVVGERILLLPMIIEQIESKNISNLEGTFPKSNASNNISNHLIMGANVLSFPILFLENLDDLGNYQALFQSLLSSDKSDSTTGARNWLAALTEGVIDSFVFYVGKIKKPISENGKLQLGADKEYLQSIFYTLSVPSISKFSKIEF